MTNLEMNRNIADFIGCYCAKWNLSIAKFAEKCNIPYMTMKRIMACNVQKIDVYTISRIAQITKTSIMEIIGMDNENLELYKRISLSTAYDREVLTCVLNVLEKLHISGKECKEIPYTDLGYDKISYLVDARFLSSRSLDFSQMERITFRSSFSDGFSYFGFRLPDNRLNPYYQKGNILLAVNDHPADGDLGIFAWKDEGNIRLIFRKVREHGRYTELLPITNMGRKYVIDNENLTDLINWVVIGVVVGIIR